MKDIVIILYSSLHSEWQVNKYLYPTSSMNKKLSSTIVLYAIWIAIVIMRLSLGTFQYIALWLILAFVALVIKDILVYFVDLKPTSKITYIGTRKQETGIRGKLYYYLLMNRVYVFPVVLVMYLTYLLIKQTHLWNLQDTIFYQITNENVLLVIVIISWIFTVWKEDQDKKYQKIVTSMNSTYVSLALSIVLSLLWTYIIYEQTMSLWWISYFISSIAGILIFLIGVMIIEEEGEIN